MSSKIAIAGVSERDIDLLLLEEFQSSTSFQEWFVTQILGASTCLGRCVAAERSVTHSTGESDLEITFSDASESLTRIMIENKVNAGLQHQQAARYHERGDFHIASNQCVACHIVIVAPAHYFGSPDATKGFGSRITYEQILAWFLNATELGERRKYKVALLKSAIDKGTLGYQPEEDALATCSWRDYWRLARDYAPELEMKQPGIKPSGQVSSISVRLHSYVMRMFATSSIEVSLIFSCEAWATGSMKPIAFLGLSSRQT